MQPGRVQLMGAGTGIYHSEFNPSETESTRLLQIWIQPEQAGLEPSYQEQDSDLSERSNRWLTLASPHGEEGIVDIRQDTRILNAELKTSHSLELPASMNRKGWLQVLDGEVTVGDLHLKRGDASRWKMRRLKICQQAPVRSYSTSICLVSLSSKQQIALKPDQKRLGFIAFGAAIFEEREGGFSV